MEFPSPKDYRLVQNTSMGFLFSFYRYKNNIQSSLSQSNKSSGEQQQWLQYQKKKKKKNSRPEFICAVNSCLITSYLLREDERMSGISHHIPFVITLHFTPVVLLAQTATARNY